MKPFNQYDLASIQKIEVIQNEMHRKIKLAEEREKNNEHFEAWKLYNEAQHLSYYVGEGLKIEIMNEDVDRDNWHFINKRINFLDKILFGFRTQLN